MKRNFEKISFEEFKKNFGENKELYDSYRLPCRATKYSAGYDFFAIEGFVLKPGERKIIPTGYKAIFGEDEMLLLLIRSGMGFKHNIRMCNQVGVIESDYYNNMDNEGHMFIALQNEGNEDFIVKKNEKYTQAIFTKFLTCDNEEITNVRTGGFGSTDKKEG